MQNDRSNRMHLKSLLGLACGLALLAPGAALAADPVAVATVTGPDTVTRGDAFAHWTGSCSNCGGMTLHYEWDRDNDGVIAEHDSGLYISSIYNSYTTLGQKTIKLKTTGVNWGAGGGTQSATTTKTITVVNAKPDVNFTCTPGVVEVGDPMTCEVTKADDPDTDEPLTLAWDVDGDGFDDGTGTTVTTTFSTAGEKHISLRGTDVDGGTSVMPHSYGAWVPPAGQAFSMSATESVEGNEVTFTAPYAAGEEGDSVYERRWDFDGDGDWDASGVGKRVVSQLFDEPGTYDVRMHVRAQGVPDSAKITTQRLVVKALPVVHPDPPKDGDKGGQDGGGAGGGTTGGGGGSRPAAPAPVANPAVKAPAFVPNARTAAPKRPAAKKKTCKAAKKSKKGKRSRTCATKRKSSRAKTRKRR